MIQYEDQMEFFRLAASSIKKDIDCYAFGGTAMMFYGYKDGTKDIDLLFEDGSAMKEFILALKSLGFIEHSAIGIYRPEKLRDKGKPLMFGRSDYRVDIFLKTVFRTKMSPNMKENLYAVHEFRQKHRLTVFVLRKEHIVQLKAVTERQNDLDDILKIVQRDKSFDWQYVIEEVLWQHRHGNSWARLDTERMLNELKKYVLIEKGYFDLLYKG